METIEVEELRPPSRAPWAVAVLAVLGAGVAGWLLYVETREHSATEAQRKELASKIDNAVAQRQELQKKLDAAEAERAKLAAAHEELTKDVQSKDEELGRLKGTYDQLQERLKSELSSGDVQLTQADGKLRVDLVDKVLFNSGEALISKRGENVLLRVGAILAGVEDKQIQVSGHTDQTPISDKKVAQFPSNWELSVARATNVVRFLQDQAHVPPERLVASGYGEYHPIASNKTAVGRARNRRIEILLTPSLAPHAIGKAKLVDVATKAKAKKK